MGNAHGKRDVVTLTLRGSVIMSRVARVFLLPVDFSEAGLNWVNCSLCSPVSQ